HGILIFGNLFSLVASFGIPCRSSPVLVSRAGCCARRSTSGWIFGDLGSPRRRLVAKITRALALLRREWTWVGMMAVFMVPEVGVTMLRRVIRVHVMIGRTSSGVIRMAFWMIHRRMAGRIHGWVMAHGMIH